MKLIEKKLFCCEMFSQMKIKELIRNKSFPLAPQGFPSRISGIFWVKDAKINDSSKKLTKR